MTILVFEFMVGGGVADQHPLDDHLKVFFEQGHSMLKAVCEDLSSLGHRLIVPVDVKVQHSLPASVSVKNVATEGELDSALTAAANEAQHILLIAPESDGCLEHFADLLSPWAERFLSPDLEFIRLTANKWKCHQWLSQRDVPCPETVMVTGEETPSLSDSFFPCVAKPVDGAGSEGVRLIESRKDLSSVEAPILLQKFVSGTPASVSVIVSGEEIHFLEPGRQVFDNDPFGIHLRTEYPLERSLKERALKLAQMTLTALPKTQGYFGIDMVLADDPNNDVVIEINPRLTTSWVWLREYNGENLASKFPF